MNCFPMVLTAGVAAPSIGAKRGGLHLKAAGLTTRERQVALMVCDGMTRREIAAALCLTMNTVKTRLERAYSKLDVRNRGTGDPVLV